MSVADDREDLSVGYRRPPQHSRFRKGQSGNPGGRPSGASSGRAQALARKELFRRVQIREGDKVKWMSALQAVLRSVVTSAAKGSTSAQRHVVDLALMMERATGAAGPAQQASTAPALSDNEVARRIAAALQKVKPAKRRTKAR